MQTVLMVLSGTLIVLNKGGNNASSIDLASGEIVATLPTGREPGNIKQDHHRMVLLIPVSSLSSKEAQLIGN